ncbi:MAG: hypothetical protein AVDCRST_MAG13-3917, partial [uncultured Solirubrobacteraceae bacterium]
EAPRRRAGPEGPRRPADGQGPHRDPQAAVRQGL